MGQQNFEDNEEIIYSSYLVKKPTVSKSISSTKQLAKNWTNWSVKKTKYNHKYWCVLRKTQFSYYKDESERVAEKVIPIQDILGCRAYGDNKLDIFTKGMTLRFKSPDADVIRSWVQSINELLPHLNNYGSESDLEIAESDDEQIEGEQADEHGIQKTTQVVKGNKDTNSTSDIKSVNNGVVEEDKKFFEFYDALKPSHLIQSGVIHAKNKRSLTGRKWKSYKCELTNRSLKLYSIKTGDCRYSVPMENVVDCIEVDSKDPLFAVITFNQRLKLKANDEDELVDWIINIKSCVMVRNSLAAHTKRS
ncbi:Opy1 [Kluyveromyces lactis]|nr:Opy1 [Kluyveromyces lactis]